MVLVSSEEEQLQGKGTDWFVYLCICVFLCFLYLSVCVFAMVLVSGGGAVAPQKHQNWSPEGRTEPRGTRTKTT